MHLSLHVSMLLILYLLSTVVFSVHVSLQGTLLAPGDVTIASIVPGIGKISSLTQDRAVMRKLDRYCSSLNEDEKENARHLFVSSVQQHCALSGSNWNDIKLAFSKIMNMCFGGKHTYLEFMTEQNKYSDLASFLTIDELVQLSKVDEEIKEQIKNWSLGQLLEHSVRGVSVLSDTAVSLYTRKCKSKTEIEILQSIVDHINTPRLWEEIERKLSRKCLQTDTYSYLRAGDAIEAFETSDTPQIDLNKESHRKVVKKLCFSSLILSSVIHDLNDQSAFNSLKILSKLHLPYSELPLRFYLRDIPTLQRLLPIVGWDGRNRHGQTLLHESRRLTIESFDALIAAGADVNDRDYDGNTPLISACDSRLGESMNILQRLVSAGANVNAVNRVKCSALFVATRSSNIDVVRFLLDNSADVNSVTSGGSTALYMAVQVQSVEIVNMLLERPELNPNIQNNEGKTPLHYACFHHHSLNIIGPLVQDRRIDLSIADHHGMTPLDMAVSGRKTWLVKYLLQNGADASTVTEEDLIFWFGKRKNLRIIAEMKKILSGEPEIIQPKKRRRT